MTKYDLLHEPWMPVLKQDGTNQDVSLTEILLNTNNYIEIVEHPSVALCLYRLLIAIKGAADRDQITVQQYLQKHADKFDLYGTRPFLQEPGIEGSPLTTEKPPTALTTTRACGTNATIVDHSIDEKVTMPIAEAARWLVSFKSMVIRPNNNPAYMYKPAFGQMVSGACFFLLGKNFAETLELNKPQSIPKSDLLPWERPEEKPNTSRPKTGPLDILVGKARSVLFRPPVDGRIKQILISGGVTLTDYADYMWLMLVNDPRKGKDGGDWIPAFSYFGTDRVPKTCLTYYKEIFDRFLPERATELVVYYQLKEKAKSILFAEERLRLNHPDCKKALEECFALLEGTRTLLLRELKMANREYNDIEEQHLVFWAHVKRAFASGTLENWSEKIMDYLAWSSKIPRDKILGYLTQTGEQKKVKEEKDQLKKMGLKPTQIEAVSWLGWGGRSKSFLEEVTKPKKSPLSPSQKSFLKAIQAGFLTNKLSKEEQAQMLVKLGDVESGVEQKLLEFLCTNRVQHNHQTLAEALVGIEGGTRHLRELVSCRSFEEFFAKLSVVAKKVKSLNYNKLLAELLRRSQEPDSSNCQLVEEFVKAKGSLIGGAQ